MIFQRSFFEKGGTLQYPSFLYEEELYIAEQSRIMNLTAVFEPSLEIVHYEHSTTGTYKNAEQIRLMRASLKYIIDTYYNE